jgi:hypothetical protein
MPVTYEIDASRSLVICRAWGTLSGEDIIGHYSDLSVDPAFHPMFQQLGDLREVTAVTATTADLKTAARMRVFAPGRRRALVAESDQAYGVARMFSSFAEFQGIGVFRSMDEAERWLGLS